MLVASICFGYPITPQNEITEYFDRELPKRSGRLVQPLWDVDFLGTDVDKPRYSVHLSAWCSTMGPDDQ